MTYNIGAAGCLALSVTPYVFLALMGLGATGQELVGFFFISLAAALGGVWLCWRARMRAGSRLALVLLVPLLLLLGCSSLVILQEL